MLDPNEAAARLARATGIFIGGGPTRQYLATYGRGPVAAALRASYERGVPIAGCSAGALLMPEVCLVSPHDDNEGVLRTEPGVGLMRQLLLSAHFTQWHDLPNLLDGMAREDIGTGWGIDDDACAVFFDGAFDHALGGAVYRIDMIDKETRRHTKTRFDGSVE